VGLVVDKVELGQVFFRLLRFPLSVSFHYGSPYWGMNNRPVGGCISETISRLINMNIYKYSLPRHDIVLQSPDASW
jgi:hypothetical protein